MQIIVAKSNNNVIGINNELPWILKGDLANFKKLTTPHEDPMKNIIVMGWNTWKSLGEKPLPNRVNIILSRQKRFVPRSKFIKVVGNATDVVNMVKKDQCVSIIGGETVFRYFMHVAEDIYMTRVLIDIKPENGDKVVKFPLMYKGAWKAVGASQLHKDSDSEIEYQFIHYKKST